MTADDFQHVVVEQENDILKLSQQGIYLSARFGGLAKARVTMPELHEITLHGASHGTVRDFQSVFGMGEPV